MMKDAAQVEHAVASHYARHALAQAAHVEQAWPQRIALGNVTKAELSAHATAIAKTIDQLVAWAGENGAMLEYAIRQSGGATHHIPTHICIGTIDVAARICGKAAVSDLALQRKRVALLDENLRPDADVALHVLKAAQKWSDVDFGLLVDAARWFAEHDATGLTPRQVPLPGFSAKWLDAMGRVKLVESLCGKQLMLADRARSIEFAYLDPAYLATGARRYDSHVCGDACALPYESDCVVVVENKDTFRAFPPAIGGICLLGAGWAGTATLPALPWVRSAKHLLYWGDIDADGYEILDAYRARGLAIESMLMDMETYRTYERFGTDLSASSAPLHARAEKPLVHLTEAERAVYRMLTSPDCPGHRRIEQERIPLHALPSFFTCPLSPHWQIKGFSTDSALRTACSPGSTGKST